MEKIFRKHSLVFSLQDLDKTKLALVGGKGANLAELAGMEGIRVPDGFCISTEAFSATVRAVPSVNNLLDQLARLQLKDEKQIRELSHDIRMMVESIGVPHELNNEITRFLGRSGENEAYAVRSSATAEDLPAASFAGQQDTYLNVVGKEQILRHISKCWASLYTKRAILYRLQNNFDHRQVRLAVIVQKMIFPQVAGIAFTADPVTANRKILSVEASFGLGEALVSGRVNADTYKVREGRIISKTISSKKLAVYAVTGGGVQEREIEPERQNEPALTDEQILQLARIGRKIEQHFGCPQDIEWCLADELFYVVQSRPITTLYPIPNADVHDNRVYVSVGHQQMMTDAMKPLGLSFFLLTGNASMYAAGGRLFVDVTRELSSPASRGIILDVLGKSDPLVRDAMLTLLAREKFLHHSTDDEQQTAAVDRKKPMTTAYYQFQMDYDTDIVTKLVLHS
jgi:pyruvate,water dikinase